MSDDREQLLASLDQLRRQLDHVPSLDPSTAARLRATLREIDAALAGKPAPGGESRFGERLSQAALDFEASHPMLAGNLGSVIDALGRMGI